MPNVGTLRLAFPPGRPLRMAIFTQRYRSAHRIPIRGPAEGVVDLVSSNRHDTAEVDLLRLHLTAQAPAIDFTLVNPGHLTFLLLQKKALRAFTAQVLH